MLFAVLGTLAGPPLARASVGLWNTLETLRNDGAYSDAVPYRRASIRLLAARLVSTAATGTIPSDAGSRATEQDLVLENRPPLVLLHSRLERADGLYAVRLGENVPPLVLQAPHAWYDLNSGRIVAALFEEGAGRALCMNSAHRFKGAEDPPTDSSSDADVAHRPDSVFQAVTLGFTDGLVDPLVVQIHGFGSAYQGMAAVVSDGSTLQPSREVLTAATALRSLLGPFGVVYTGKDVPELAGTGNAQGRALSGTARFLHVELSYTVRRTLLSDGDLRARLGATLAALAARDTRALDALASGAR